MAYTKEDIIRMSADGEITQDQADKMLSELTLSATGKEPVRKKKSEDPLKALATELNKLSVSVEEAIQNQGNAIMEIGKFIPIMLSTYEAIKTGHSSISKEMLKGSKKHTQWEINATRDFRGLIEFPITIRAIN